MSSITVTVDTKAIQQDLQKRADEMKKKQIDDQLNEAFAKPTNWCKEGVFRQQIREKVEQVIERLYDENATMEKLEQRIEHHFKIALDEAIEFAAKHRSRKLAFYALNEHLKKTQGE